MGGQLRKVQCAYVLGEMQYVGMVGRMRSDCVGVMIDACNDLCAFLTVYSGTLNACGGPAGAAK